MSDDHLNYNEAVCVISCNSFSETEDQITVTKKGIRGIIKYCGLRKNESLQKYLESQPNVVLVHEECRKNFTRARGLAESQSDSDSNLMNPPKKLRSTSDTFQWDSTCFFCCKEVILDVHRPKINANTHFARTLSLGDNVICAIRGLTNGP